MRRSLLGVVPAMLALLSSCTGMVQSELDQTHEKLTALQELVNGVNQDLVSLQQIVSELNDGQTVSAVTPVDPDGYDLSFRDGKVVRISYGKDGADGIVHPVGVALGEDGRYYWTVDFTFMLDADGNPIVAAATDTLEFVEPAIRVEEGEWRFYPDKDKEEYVKLANAEDMDGVGVFKDVIVEADKVCLVQWDDTVLEIAKYIPVKVSFKGQPRDTVVIGAGETLRVPFEVVVEGDTEDQLVVTSGTDGTYFSKVRYDAETGMGLVTVTAPEVFEEGYIILSATCDGVSALKMVVFQPRVTKPADAVVIVPIGKDAGSYSFSYDANFEYVVSSGSDSWATAVANPEEKAVTFQVESNTSSEIRFCEITVSPKNNPEYVVTTFQLLQATPELSAYPREIEVPAEGGDFDVWLTAPIGFKCDINGDWITYKGFVAEGDFLRLNFQVASLPEGTETRKGTIDLMSGSTYFNQITIVQKSSK
ncbi:MAG: hypothetical protein IKV62_03475 [Bacteroidales bacterium]|nr:hypothetical protein [Bacteroidales bacterium]